MEKQSKLQRLTESSALILMDFRQTEVEFLVGFCVQDRLKKYKKVLDFKKDIQFSPFETTEQVYEFMKSHKNYEFDQEEVSIILCWEVIAQQFRKQIRCSFQLQQCLMDSKQILEWEICVLKRKLTETENKVKQKAQKDNEQTQKNKKRILEKQQKKLGNPNQVQPEKHPISVIRPRRGRSFKSQSFEQDIQEQKAENSINSKDLKNRGKMCNSGNSLALRQKKKQDSDLKIIIKQEEDSDEPSPNDSRKTKKISKVFKQKQKQGPNIMKVKEHKVNEEEKKTVMQKNLSKLDVKNQNVIVVGDKIRIDFPNGDFYFGQMKDGVYHGRGYYYSKENGNYEGEWKNGKKDGFGICYDCENNRYQGSFKEDKKHGRGEETYTNSQKYIGDFYNDKKQGYGVYNFANGDLYEGNWRNNYCHGEGKQVLKDGSQFIGTWLNDQRNGKGTFKDKNKNVYKQIWKHGALQFQQLVNE